MENQTLFFIISRMRILITITVFLTLLIFGHSASAQQDPQFSQNMFTKLAVNPGVSGANDAICATLLYRNQWTGFGGEPKTMLFTADMPLDVLHGGVGLAVFAADQLGAEKNFSARASYAYQLDLGSGRVGFGLNLGYQQKSLDGSKFVFNDLNDNSIPVGSVSGGAFDMGLGVYYQTEKLYAGISTQHLTKGDIKYDNISSTLERHYYLLAGYNIDLTSSLVLKPSALVKTDGVSVQADLNANLLINNRFWGGVSYRLQDAIVIMAGLEIIPNLKLGYSYDLTTSDIKTYSSGTHEIMLGYCFKKAKLVKRQFHRNVRFL